MAAATAAARVAAFSLANTAARGNFTVLAETDRARATPLLDVPLATRARISRSRDVRGRPFRADPGRAPMDAVDWAAAGFEEWVAEFAGASANESPGTE